MTETNDHKAIHLEDSSKFPEIISKGVVLVDFYADWCGPCKMLSPQLEELAVDFDGKATVLKVDVDAHGEISGEYDVSSIPTVIIFNNGDVVGEAIVGAYPKEHYETILNDLVTNGDTEKAATE